MLLIWVYLMVVASAMPTEMDVTEDYGTIDSVSNEIDLPQVEDLEDLDGSGEEEQEVEARLEPGMENDYVLMGDVLVKKSQVGNSEFDGSEARIKRQASAYAQKWINNTVYYIFHESLILAAIDYISSRTCIDFVEDGTNPDHVMFFSGYGCYSSLGRVGGEQYISLGPGCEPVGTAVHEIMHALGIYHMQSRSDRDDYVTVDLTYVPEYYQGNFYKLTPDETVDLAPYELGSVMHYGAKFFTSPSNKFSIYSKDDRYMYTMGSKIVSFFDIKRINDYYQCQPACPAATLAKCKNGGLPNPRQCTTCNCPIGYAGPLCGQRPAGCGGPLGAKPQWKTAIVKMGEAGLRNDFSYCTYWINAPKGTQIRVKITNVVNGQCNYSCQFNGIEVKKSPNTRMVNPRVCCPDTMTSVLVSSLNPTPVVVYNRRGISQFTFQYHYVGTPTE